jgi:hypothetical protein
MNDQTLFAERLRQAFTPPPTGVVGVVDRLFELCREQELRLDWQADQCYVRPLHGGPQESIQVALPKSAFRAILARVAALCNQQAPDSVSPYGGEGELTFGTDQPTRFRVKFKNTPDEQRLEVTRPVYLPLTAPPAAARAPTAP